MADFGKKWEDKFKSTWEKQFPKRLIYRLPDQQSGYAGSGGSNPCDFLCYPGNCVLMVECKAHSGQSLPFTAIRQYEKMLSYKSTYKTHIGVLVWFYEKDTIIWVSIEEMEKMVNDGEKSIGLRMLNENYKKKYHMLNVPAKKLRTFMEPDLRWLAEQIAGSYMYDGRTYVNEEGHTIHEDYMIGGFTLADIEKYCEENPPTLEQLEAERKELAIIREEDFSKSRPITPPGYKGPNATKYYSQKYIDEFEKNSDSKGNNNE